VIGRRFFILGLALAASNLLLARQASAAVSYTTAGSTYSQNFDSLPNSGVTLNGALQPTPYTDGWQDDVDPAASAQNDISIVGWHLYHPTDPSGSEDGVNHHQRFRIGNGGQNTGAFWGYGSALEDTDKALGSLGSTTVANPNGANMYMGLQLINNTGQTLNSFTLTYNGEQWRHGNTATELLSFGWSTTALDADWFSTALFNAETGLNFTPPVTSTTVGEVDLAVDGNTTGRVNNISTTVNNINWTPGRWPGDRRRDVLRDNRGRAIDGHLFRNERASDDAFHVEQQPSSKFRKSLPRRQRAYSDPRLVVWRG
jgi:hypothetical protein